MTTPVQAGKIQWVPAPTAEALQNGASLVRGQMGPTVKKLQEDLNALLRRAPFAAALRGEPTLETDRQFGPLTEGRLSRLCEIAGIDPSRPTAALVAALKAHAAGVEAETAGSGGAPSPSATRSVVTAGASGAMSPPSGSAASTGVHQGGRVQDAPLPAWAKQVTPIGDSIAAAGFGPLLGGGAFARVGAHVNELSGQIDRLLARQPLPFAVPISMGLNDGRSDDAYVASIAKQVERLQAAGVRVVLLGPYAKRRDLVGPMTDLRPKLQALATRTGAAYFDVSSITALPGVHMDREGVHWNAAGYRAIAAGLVAALQPGPASRL